MCIHRIYDEIKEYLSKNLSLLYNKPEKECLDKINFRISKRKRSSTRTRNTFNTNSFKKYSSRKRQRTKGGSNGSNDNINTTISKLKLSGFTPIDANSYQISIDERRGVFLIKAERNHHYF